MEIYIPTLGRPFQETLFELPPSIRQNVTLVLAPGVHRTAEAAKSWGIKYVQCPSYGIGPTRQWIIENATDKKIVMLDDDLVFAARRSDELTKFREALPAELLTLFSSIDACLDSWAHVGVSTREGGNRDTSDFAFNTRLLRILAYRTDVLHRESIRFDRLELMEDFEVTLQLLRRGYANCKINWIVHNQRSSNAPGGCSTYRTLEKQSAAARGLEELHPEFVSVVTKKTKTAWNGQERQDVRISWKKAFCADTAGTPAVLDTNPQSDTT
jgi:hypothetical protein